MDTFAPFWRTVTAFAAAAILASGQLYLIIPFVDVMAGDWKTDAASVANGVTVFSLAYAVGFLIFGPLTDRYGPRRILFIGLLAAVATTSLLATAPNLETFYAMRIAQGFTISAFSPPAFAYLATRPAPNRRPASLASLTSGFLASGVFGQLAGQWFISGPGWHTAFLVTGALFVVIAFIMRAVMLPDPPYVAPALAADGSKPRSPYAVLFSDPALLLLYGAALACLSAFVGGFAALELTGTSAPTLLTVRLIALVPIVATPFIVYFWLKKVAPVGRAIAGLSLVALSEFGMAAGGPPLVLMLLVVLGVANTAPALTEAIGARAGALRGRAISVFVALLFFGASGVTAMVAALAGHGIRTVMMAMAAVAITGGVLVASAGVVLRADGRKTRAQAALAQPARAAEKV